MKDRILVNDILRLCHCRRPRVEARAKDSGPMSMRENRLVKWTRDLRLDRTFKFLRPQRLLFKILEL